MPDLASWHPQVVHFVVALGAVGLIARLDRMRAGG
jgi:hypothetical protein